MAVSKKTEYLRDIAMLIRRESISFQDNDRVPLELSRIDKNGNKIGYCIGRIYYDFDSGKIKFDLYNDKGDFILPANNEHTIEDKLISSELLAVRERLSDYVEMSINRAQNINLINSILERPFECFTNCDVKLYVDRKRDGVMKSVNMFGLFKEDTLDQGYVLCKDDDFDPAETGYSYHNTDKHWFNYPLSDINDIGIANILRFLEQNLSKTQSEEIDVQIKADEKLERNQQKSVKGKGVSF